MIRFQGVSKIYQPNTIALEDITFEVKPKEFVSIVGKSGAGKTTLLKLLLAEEEPTRGSIFFDGQEVGKIKRSRLHSLRRRIGTVFQDYKLLPTKNAFENVAYIMEVMGASTQEIQRDVPQVLEVVGLQDKKNNFPNELSGGERQRLAIARALVHRPDVILADEPTGNLDPYNTSEIIRLLVKIYELGTTVILSTHAKEVINSLKKRVITLDGGKIVRDEERGRFII